MGAVPTTAGGSTAGAGPSTSGYEDEPVIASSLSAVRRIIRQTPHRPHTGKLVLVTCKADVHPFGPRRSPSRASQHPDSSHQSTGPGARMAIVLVTPCPGVNSGTGSRTDFAVNVPVRTHFEVRHKTASEALTGDARRRADMMAELERIESPDFWLDVDAFSGAQIPSMRRVRQEAEQWLDSLDYDDQVQRHDQEQQARRERLARPMPGLDAGPLERARYLAAKRQFEPPAFERSGEGWKVVITAHPRPADKRGPGQFTIGLGTAGEAHIENAEAVETTIRRKLSQHTGLTDPLVIVLDLSLPIIDDSEIAAMLYGPVAMTMLNPATVLSVARDRAKGIWPQPLKQPPRPARGTVPRLRLRLCSWNASHGPTPNLATLLAASEH